MNKLQKKMTDLLSKQKFGKDSLLILILAGLLMLVIAWPTEPSGGKKKSDATKSEKEDSQEVMLNVAAGSDMQVDYETRLEQRLSALLREMDGVGNVRVMVTFANSGEEIPLKDVTRSDRDTTEADGEGGMRVINERDYGEVTIYVTNEEGKRIPYIVRTLEPEVIGVAVIAEGGGNPNIQKNITAVIQSLFRIDANRIIVTKMKS